jgi:hypothetical protein
MGAEAIAQLIVALEPEAAALIVLLVKKLHRNQPTPNPLPFPDAPSPVTVNVSSPSK